MTIHDDGRALFRAWPDRQACRWRWEGRHDEDTGDVRTGAEADSGAELLDLPDYRQEHNYDCGPAVVHSVCESFKVGPALHQDYLDQLWNHAGCRHVGRCHCRLSIRAGPLAVTAGSDLDIDDLAGFSPAASPSFARCRCTVRRPNNVREDRGHYVAVIGVGLGQVFIQDPSAGRRLMDAEAWLADWFDRGADGTEYTRFGIAVGNEPPGSDDDESDTDDPPDTGTASAGSDVIPAVLERAFGQLDELHAFPPTAMQTAVIQAGRTLLTDAVRRMTGRIGIQAGRAAVNAKRFMAWLEGVRGNESFCCPGRLPAGRGGPGSALPQEGIPLADWLLREPHAELAGLADSCTPARLAAEVSSRMSARWRMLARCGGRTLPVGRAARPVSWRWPWRRSGNRAGDDNVRHVRTRGHRVAGKIPGHLQLAVQKVNHSHLPDLGQLVKAQKRRRAEAIRAPSRALASTGVDNQAELHHAAAAGVQPIRASRGRSG